MSYDAHLELDAGAHRPMEYDIGNMTSNLSAAWALALGCPLLTLDGKLGSEVAPIVSEAVEAMADPCRRPEFDALMPSNGWGTLENARDYLERIWSACRAYPRATFRIGC